MYRQAGRQWQFEVNARTCNIHLLLWRCRLYAVCMLRLQFGSLLMLLQGFFFAIVVVGTLAIIMFLFLILFCSCCCCFYESLRFVFQNYVVPMYTLRGHDYILNTYIYTRCTCHNCNNAASCHMRFTYYHFIVATTYVRI